MMVKSSSRHTAERLFTRSEAVLSSLMGEGRCQGDEPRLPPRLRGPAEPPRCGVRCGRSGSALSSGEGPGAVRPVGEPPLLAELQKLWPTFGGLAKPGSAA